MHKRTMRAAVWEDRPVSEDATPANRFDQLREADAGRQTIWAKVPIRTAAGRCLGVRLQRGEVWVALAGPPQIRWVPAERALTPAEAARWRAVGF